MTKKISIPQQFVGVLVVIVVMLLQVGKSYYFSVFFLTFATLSAISILSPNFDTRKTALICIGCIPFVLKGLFNSIETADLRSIFIPFREMVCFISLFTASIFISSKQLSSNHVFKICLTILISFLAITAAQTFYIAKGNYLGLPPEMYVLNSETIAAVDKALLHQSLIRPTAFYGEPSYTGWITLSTLVAGLSCKTKKYENVLLVVVSLAIAYLCQSFAGIISIAVYLTVWFLKEARLHITDKIVSFLILLIIIISLFVLQSNNSIVVRAGSILSFQDESFDGRIMSVLPLLQQMLIEGQVWGVNNYGTNAIDNAALGLVLQYGILTIPIAISITNLTRYHLLLLYLFLSINFNGAFFRFDKIIIFAFVIGIYQSMHSKSETSSEMYHK